MNPSGLGSGTQVSLLWHGRDAQGSAGALKFNSLYNAVQLRTVA